MFVSWEGRKIVYISVICQLALVSSDRVLDNYESSSATGMFMAPLTYGSLTLTGQGELEMFNTLHSFTTETIYGRLVSKSLRLHSRGMTSASQTSSASGSPICHVQAAKYGMATQASLAAVSSALR